MDVEPGNESKDEKKDESKPPVKKKKQSTSALWALCGAICIALVNCGAVLLIGNKSLRENALPASVLSLATAATKHYKKTQFLGFSINTLPDEAATWPTSSRGTASLREDVQGRIKILKAALDVAYNRSERESGVLKVFVAPEFFWQGIATPYDGNALYDCLDGTDCFNPLSEIGKELDDLVKDSKWTHWLFVFGSIVAAEPDPEGKKRGKHLETLTEGDKAMFYDFVPIHRGAGTDKWLLARYQIGGLDFYRKGPPRTADAGSLQQPSTPFIARKWIEAVKYNAIDGSTFSSDGILFGIESCGDHGVGKLKQSLSLQSRTTTNIHIITSVGAEMLENSVASPIVMLQDGGWMGQTQYHTRMMAGKRFKYWTLAKTVNGAPVFGDSQDATNSIRAG
eukprot:TRINITY_DN3228_c0_g1_i3.p1 TRINITY_DN3228_c0_g1~~TRINITY_DN3228_c0_g1_i3.p1  ORF type:complete len:396 (+),score=45.69 TRINITY_DN3228_c0_g1_i3:108-1295(+)